MNSCFVSCFNNRNEVSHCFCVCEQRLVDPYSVHINRTTADINCIKYTHSPPELCAQNIQLFSFSHQLLCNFIFVFRIIYVSCRKGEIHTHTIGKPWVMGASFQTGEIQGKYSMHWLGRMLCCTYRQWERLRRATVCHVSRLHSSLGARGSLCLFCLWGSCAQGNMQPLQ